MKLRSNILNLRDVVSRPLRDKTGRILSDKELIPIALSELEKTEKAGEQIPVPPEFVEWLRGAAAHIKNGGSLAEYKRSTIYRSIPNYDILRNVAK